MSGEFISRFDWPETVQVYDGAYGQQTVPDFTPENFRFLVGKVNELAAEVAAMKNERSGQ